MQLGRAQAAEIKIAAGLFDLPTATHSTHALHAERMRADRTPDAVKPATCADAACTGQSVAA